MKTNYDHLIDGGIDALIGKNFSGADCECCVCLVGEDCVYSGEECARAIKQWLESEYVEPDSWEKLEEDVREFANVYDKVIELLDIQAAITQICATSSQSPSTTRTR